MGRVLMTGGGSGGGSSDDCTASANDILKGKTAVYNGSDDDIGAGTLELTGNASDGYVYSGKTYYNTDAHTRRTGSMTVGSILNFSAAVYSGRQVLLKWQNPYAAVGRPFGGVFINYSTSGYPGTGGTRIYTGYGNNTASGGWSQAIVTLPNLNTTYYFSCTAYVNCSAGDVWGNTINASCKTASVITKTITSSQNYTIPAGYSYVDIFCVGGGGGGALGWYSGGNASGYYYCTGGGGGGGYTATAANISVSAGQTLVCTVGGGGAKGSSSNRAGSKGGTTSVTRNGSTLCTAAGGDGGAAGTSYSSTPEGQGGNGGSGGGDGHRAGRGVSTKTSKAGNGGTNGGKGYDGFGNQNGGTGQGRTTRPFGESSGTVYSGGGGGGGIAAASNTRGYGGTSGGGSGGYANWDGSSVSQATAGSGGSANTGGGGGGGGSEPASVAVNCLQGGNGGSGVIIIRVK